MALSELQYWQSIADSLKKMGGAKSAAAKQGGSAGVPVSVTNNIDTETIAESLDEGLYTTVLDADDEEQRVGAIRTMADNIKAELEAALFDSSVTPRVSWFAKMHEELSTKRLLLSRLADVSLNNLQDGDVLRYIVDPQTSEGAWNNVAPSTLLAAIMGDQQIGGWVSDLLTPSIQRLKMMYWTGSAWSTIPLGDAALSDITTAAADILSGGSKLPTAGAVADKLADYVKATISSPSANDVISYSGSAWVNVTPTALFQTVLGTTQKGGVKTSGLWLLSWSGSAWVENQLGSAAGCDVSSSSSDIYSGSNYIPTAGAVAAKLLDYAKIGTTQVGGWQNNGGQNRFYMMYWTGSAWNDQYPLGNAAFLDVIFDSNWSRIGQSYYSDDLVTSGALYTFLQQHGLI